MPYLCTYLIMGLPFGILFWLVTTSDPVWGQWALWKRLLGFVIMCVGWFPFVVWMFLGELFD